MPTPNTALSPAVRDRLQQVRHLFLDMDGTLYRGQQLLPNTRSFLDQLHSLKIGRTFLTNNCSLAPANYLAKLERMGIPASLDDIVTSTHSAIYFLHTHPLTNTPKKRTLYVVGTDDLRDQLAQAGFQILRDDAPPTAPATALPDIVVLGYSAELSYANLCKAAWWVSRGSPYIATHPDPHCPTDADTLLIDCGALTRCIQTATDVPPTAVLGKPNPLMLEPVMQRLQLKPEEVAVVGDRLGTDVAMGRTIGALGILVMTGATSAQQLADTDAPPDLAIEDLGALADVLSTL